MALVTRHTRLVLGLLAIGTAGTVFAQAPLTGSGNNLPMPLNSGHAPAVNPQLTLYDPNDLTGGFTGTWGPPTTDPVLAPWVGTFSADGPIPASVNNPPGFTDYRDFTNLAAGVLPAGTFFVLSDVDRGSATNETFTLHAWDPNGVQIVDPWLSIPTWGTAGSQSQQPGWSFNNGTYFFDGSTVAGNPNVTVYLESLYDIGRFTVDRTSEWASFRISAPIPEPASLSLLLLGGLLSARRRL